MTIICVASTKGGVGKTPTATGFYVFSGARIIRNGMFERLHVPVEVVEVAPPNGKVELGVKMIGRQQAFPLRMFDGEWVRLEVGAT